MWRRGLRSSIQCSADRSRRERMDPVESAIRANEDRLWPRLLTIAALSFPTVVLSMTCFVVGSLMDIDSVKEASVTLLPLSSLIGFIPITFGGFAASHLMRDRAVPKRTVQAAWLFVVIGALLQCGLAAALMTPGLIELP